MALGIGTAAGIIGGAYGIARSIGSDERQLKQQKKLTDQQVEAQKDLGVFNSQQAYDLWKKTGVVGQKEQLQMAGLNPALIYGQSGVGGQTTGGQAGSVSGGQAATSAATEQAATQQGMGLLQAGLMQAQVENIKADTKKKEVEADVAGGVGKENIVAGTGLTNVTTKLKEIEASVAGKTQADAVRTIVAGADKLMAEAQLTDNNKTISDQTMIEQKTKIQQEAIGSILRNEATRTGINLDQAKIGEITQTLLQKWEQLKLGKEGLQVARDNMEQLTEAMLWGAGIQAGGNLVRGVMDIATKGGAGTVTQTMRDNFDGTGHTTTTRTTPIR